MLSHTNHIVRVACLKHRKNGLSAGASAVRGRLPSTR
jgi:hypothetical protein